MSDLYIKYSDVIPIEKNRKLTRREKKIYDLGFFDCSEKAEAYAEQKVREFAEWLPQHFDLRFSNDPELWIDEFFNHTREKVLLDYKKKNICDYDKDCPTCWSRAFCKEYNETVKGAEE